MNRDVYVGRLEIEMPGLTAAEARQLAARLGEGLAEAEVGSHPRLAVALERLPGEPIDRLARRILIELLRRAGTE